MDAAIQCIQASTVDQEQERATSIASEAASRHGRHTGQTQPNRASGAGGGEAQPYCSLRVDSNSLRRSRSSSFLACCPQRPQSACFISHPSLIVCLRILYRYLDPGQPGSSQSISDQLTPTLEVYPSSFSYLPPCDAHAPSFDCFPPSYLAYSALGLLAPSVPEAVTPGQSGEFSLFQSDPVPD